MDNYLLISDAAKAVCVESHVLRYWEEELQLPIKRNELGHRYYTKEDVERFKNIKDMKERGLQLKAIKMILKNGKLDMLSNAGESAKGAESPVEALKSEKEDSTTLRNKQVPGEALNASPMSESREEKAQRLQWIMQQMIKQAVRENNEELVQKVKESVIKELDYQFRMQEEREEERARIEAERSENYYRRMDELLRKKSNRKTIGEFIGKKEKASHNMKRLSGKSND